MPKFFLSLFIVFSLLFAPIAHASGMACLDDMKSISKVEIQKDFAKESKQTDDKSQKSGGHHCCCSHTTCDRVSAKSPDLVPTIAKVVIPSTDDRIASIAFGPPLEPPSHA